MSSYTYEELESMTVKQVRALVRKHNLHVALKRYSTMKKIPLIKAFLAKKPIKPAEGMLPPPAPKKRQAVARMITKPPRAPQKKQQANDKHRAFGLQRAERRGRV